MNDLYFIRLSGQIRGPFNWSQLIDLRNRGRLQGFHEVSADRVTWVEAGTLAELFPPQAPPPRMPGPATPGGALPGAGDQWYYADAVGQRQGPVDRQQLAALAQDGTVHEDTLAWCKGMTDWQPLGQAAPDIFAAPPPETPLHFGPGVSGQAVFEWKAPRIGVMIALIATFIFGGSILMFGLAVVVATLSAAPQEGNLTSAANTVALMLVITQLIILAAVILESVGFGFCWSAPPRSGARGLAIATLALAIGHLVLDFIFFISVLSGGAGDVGSGPEAFAYGFARAGFLLILRLVSVLLFLAYRGTFLLFLRAVAMACRATELAQHIMYLLILYVVLVFVSLLTALVLYQGAQGNAPPAGVLILTLALLMLVFALAWLAWYIVILFRCRAVMAPQPARAS